MKATLFTTITILYLLTTGCAVKTVTKGEAFADMYSENPKSILVVPAINQSTAADAPDLYASTIAEPLANSGFYVLPIELTDRFLKKQGLAEGAQLLDVPPEKFADVFGADAVLFVTISKWDTNYYVLGGNVTVGVQFVLKSTKTGSTLWNYTDQLVIDTSGDNNNGGGLLGAIIATAINTSMQDYVPIARRVNITALHAIPFGNYHKLYGKDKTLTINPTKIQKTEQANAN